MCLAQGPQRSDTGEGRTRGPSVSSVLSVYLFGTCALIEVNTVATYLFFLNTKCELSKNSNIY